MCALRRLLLGILATVLDHVGRQRGPRIGKIRWHFCLVWPWINLSPGL
jgi:hypothetical protein